VTDLRTYLSDSAQRDLASLRASLDARLLALEAALAHPEPHDSLEDLVMDLARVASAEVERSAAQRWLEAQLKLQDREAEHQSGREAVAALRAEIERLRAAVAAAEAELGRERSARRDLSDTADARQRDLQTARGELTTAKSEATAIARELESTRAALAQRDGKLAAVEAKCADLERAAQAEAERAKSAEAAVAAEAARAKSAEAAAAAEAARARTVEEQAAAQRAAAAVPATAPVVEADWQRRIETADARIKDLELQLFGRDRGTPDADVDLASLLEAPLPAGDKPIRRFSRYTFRSKIEMRIGDDAGVLVDLSVAGAQVLTALPLDLNREDTIELPSDEVPIGCRGRVVWTRADPQSKGKALRYRAGLLFADADPAAVEAFIIRYSGT
jgi:hypothetical protein